MPRIKLEGNRAWRTLTPGSSLLGALLGAGAPITSDCRNGYCGEDLVVIVEGGGGLSPPSLAEQRTLLAVGAPKNARLPCVTKVLEGDVVVVIPEVSYRRFPKADMDVSIKK